MDPTDGLLGRDAALARIRTAVEDGASGPVALVISGDPGSGRTRLLAAAIHLARTVHAARGAGPCRVVTVGAGEPLPTVATLAREGHPVLLTVDDVADSDFLRSLTALPPAPITVLVTTAPALTPPTPVETLMLEPLSRVDAARLLDAQPVRVVGHARARLLHRAAGNPGAIVALAAGTTPADTTDRYDALPDTARRLVLYTATAVTAADSTDGAGLDTLMTAAGVPGMAAWAPAVDAGLVTIRNRAVRFTHAPAGPILYRHAAASARRRAHRDLAALTTGLERARHLAAATLRPDETVAAALEAAADDRLRAPIPSDADPFDAAAALHRAADRSPEPSEAARRYVRAALTARDFGAPHWVGEIHARLRQVTTDPDVLAPAVRAAATSLSRFGRQREALDLLEAFLRRTPPTAPDTYLDLVDVYAIVTALSGLPEHRATLADLLGRAADGTPVRNLIHTFVRTILDPPARPGRALWEDPDAAQRACVGDSPAAEIEGWMMLGTAAWHEDETRVAIDALRHAVALRRQRQFDGAGIEGLPVLAGALLDRGEWTEADRVLTEMTELAAVLDLPVTGAIGDALTGWLRALRGEDTPAASGWPPLDLQENRAVHVRLARAQGVAALGRGEYATAYRHLRSLFDQDGEPLHPFHSPRAIGELAGAAARADRRADALIVLDRLRHASGAEPTTRMRLLLHRCTALLDPDADPERHFRLATVDPAGEHWPYERAMARLHYGEWLRRRRRPLDARALLAAALATFETLGARPAAEQARLELRASGGETDETIPPALKTLTPQQREIVLLVAQGLTNREIAERLLLSPRTVGAHLYSVYPKLGVSRRQELRDIVNV